MSYYFPTFITSVKVKAPALKDFIYTVNSGKNALRLGLRNLGLPAGSKIAIPAFTCVAVSEAVKEEGLKPVTFDIYPDGNYWTNYSADRILTEGIKGIVLVHLYGFIHPDTGSLSDFCIKDNIKLIHDAAQSYGIDENLLLQGNGIVYSFGPGKSLTAAGGGWIKGINSDFYNKNCQQTESTAVARQFLKSRIYGYHYTLWDKISALFGRKKNEQISRMSEFAKQVNAYAISTQQEITPARKSNYGILKKAIEQNALFSIPYDDQKGQYFKMILLVKENPASFKKYLLENKVPFFSFPDRLMAQESKHPNLKKYAEGFIELSTEACLPKEEMERIAVILKNYK